MNGQCWVNSLEELKQLKSWQREEIKKLYLHLNTENVTGMAFLFSDFEKIKELEFVG